MQSLNGGKGDAIGIDRRDVFVVDTQSKGRVKVLRHGSHMSGIVVVILELPRRDLKGRHFP